MTSSIQARLGQQGDALRRVGEAYQAREQIRASEIEASHELAERVITAQEAGITITAIAAELGLTRKAIYDLTGWHRGEKSARS